LLLLADRLSLLLNDQLSNVQPPDLKLLYVQVPDPPALYSERPDRQSPDR